LARFDTVVTVNGLVFVSYSHADRPYVEVLAAHLRAAGIEVWYDDELAAGDRFDAVIHVQIDECDAVIVVLSPAAVASEWVDREIGYALQQGKKVLPLLLSPCEDQALLVNVHHDDVTTGTMPSARFMGHLANLIASRTVGGVLDRTQLTVARLAAEGLSHHEIASRMLLSRRTVSFHLMRVFAKLGVSSVAALARRLKGDSRPEPTDSTS
jgi:DNA-binding CsgD family transcriptional regulator